LETHWTKIRFVFTAALLALLLACSSDPTDKIKIEGDPSFFNTNPGSLHSDKEIEAIMEEIFFHVKGNFTWTEERDANIPDWALNIKPAERYLSDCVGFTALIRKLAQSNGIPTRIVRVYTPDGTQHRAAEALGTSGTLGILYDNRMSWPMPAEEVNYEWRYVSGYGRVMDWRVIKND